MVAAKKDGKQLESVGTDAAQAFKLADSRQTTALTKPAISLISVILNGHEASVVSPCDSAGLAPNLGDRIAMEVACS